MRFTSTYQALVSTVAAEATTLAHMRRATLGLPVEQQRRLDEGLDQYVHAIVDDEWKAMSVGKESPRASAALETLYALYQSYDPPPADGPESEFYSAGVAGLADATSARRARLGLGQDQLPTPLRLFLPGWEGNINVKWLRRLKVVDQPYMTREETSKYTDLMPDGTARQFTLMMDAKSV